MFVPPAASNSLLSPQEQAVDPRTRLLMYKMVNAGVLENINGCISTGKESVIFHADGGRWVDEEEVLKNLKETVRSCLIDIKCVFMCVCQPGGAARPG